MSEWRPFVERKECLPGDYAEATDDDVKRTWIVIRKCRAIGICKHGLIIEVDGHARIADASFVLPVSEACPV